MIRLNLFDIFFGQVNFIPSFTLFFFLLIANFTSNPLQINNFTF